jgi:hypothetical protein
VLERKNDGSDLVTRAAWTLAASTTGPSTSPGVQSREVHFDAEKRSDGQPLGREAGRPKHRSGPHPLDFGLRVRSVIISIVDKAERRRETLGITELGARLRRAFPSLKEKIHRKLGYESLYDLLCEMIELECEGSEFKVRDRQPCSTSDRESNREPGRCPEHSSAPAIHLTPRENAAVAQCRPLDLG